MSRLRLRLPAFHTQLTSFLWMFDLKVGATVITLFALFNKIAGIYGVIAIFQGGTFAQVSLYLYSLITLFVFLWAIRGIADEDTNRVLKYAHVFLGDHLVSTAWTFFFGIDWFVYNRHDGEKPPLNEYQAGLMGLIEHIEGQYETTKNVHHQPLEGPARVDAAQRVWRAERGFSGTVLLLGWFIKIYFALVIYSYALHLRHGTYRSLPLSKSSGYVQANGHYSAIPENAFELEGGEDESDDEADDRSKQTRRSTSSHRKQNTQRATGMGDMSTGPPHIVDSGTAAAKEVPSRSTTPAGTGIQRSQSRLGRRMSASGTA